MLHRSRHLRNVREDVMGEGDLKSVLGAEKDVRDALAIGDLSVINEKSKALGSLVQRLWPPRRFAGLAENFEMLVVAVVVAMGFRTYFLQPFKIPTGSMQPTLYGITSEWNGAPDITDRFPLKPVKWLFTGTWLKEIRAAKAGHADGPHTGGLTDPSSEIWYIAGHRYRIPRDARERGEVTIKHGDYIEAGELLWAGYVTHGDHLFVDKVSWNFRRPRLGEVIVFYTDGISGLPSGSHYIKRLCGLPGDSVSIDPPYLVIDGHRVTQPKGIARICERAPGYAGYTLPMAGREDTVYLRDQEDVMNLGPRDYLALGDNTLNSRDSRYWGAVPRKNLVGPALLVYWPFSERWFLID